MAIDRYRLDYIPVISKAGQPTDRVVAVVSFSKRPAGAPPRAEPDGSILIRAQASIRRQLPTDVKAYKCNHRGCSAAFPQRSRLQAHVRSAHLVVPLHQKQKKHGEAKSNAKRFHKR